MKTYKLSCLLPLLLYILFWTEKSYSQEGIDNLIYFGDRLIYNDTLPTWANILSNNYGKTLNNNVTNFATFTLDELINPIPLSNLLQQRNNFYQTNPVFNPNNIYITSTSHDDFYYYTQNTPPALGGFTTLQSDYLDPITGNWIPVAVIGANTSVFFDIRINEVANHVRELINRGAHNHIVLNHFREDLFRFTPPLNLPPNYEELIKKYNGKLANSLLNIADTNILVPDIYKLTEEINQNNDEYIPLGERLYNVINVPGTVNNDIFTQSGHKIIEQYIISLIDAPLMVGQAVEIPIRTGEMHTNQIMQELQSKHNSKNIILLVGGQKIDYKNSISNHSGFYGNTTETNVIFINYLPKCTVGFALGHYYNPIHFNNQKGDASTHEILSSLIGKININKYNTLALTIGAGHINYNINRQIPLGLVTRTEHGSIDGWHFFSDAKANYEVTLNNSIILLPFIGLELQKVTGIKYRETGTTRSTTMVFKINDKYSIKPYFGIDIQQTIFLHRNWSFVPSANFKINYEVLERNKLDLKASVSDIPLEYHAFYPIKSQEITGHMQLGGTIQKNNLRFGIYLSTIQDFDVLNINQIHAKINYII